MGCLQTDSGMHHPADQRTLFDRFFRSESQSLLVRRTGLDSRSWAAIVAPPSRTDLCRPQALVPESVFSVDAPIR